MLALYCQLPFLHLSPNTVSCCDSSECRMCSKHFHGLSLKQASRLACLWSPLTSLWLRPDAADVTTVCFQNSQQSRFGPKQQLRFCLSQNRDLDNRVHAVSHLSEALTKQELEFANAKYQQMSPNFIIVLKRNAKSTVNDASLQLDYLVASLGSLYYHCFMLVNQFV